MSAGGVSVAEGLTWKSGYRGVSFLFQLQEGAWVSSQAGSQGLGIPLVPG